MFGKKKKQPKQIVEFENSGIHMEELTIQKRSLKTNFFKCLWNAVLIFTFMAGHIGFFVSSFQLPCKFYIILGSCALISLYLAFLYFTAITYNLGYIILPVIVGVIAFSMYWIVNSGFSAVLNVIISNIDSTMNLPNTSEYNEYYTNRTISITASISVLSILFGIFVNMWVARRRSALYPIIVSIILIEPSIYLNNDFSYAYLCLIFVSIILFILTKMNDSGELIYKKKYKAYVIKHKEVVLNKASVSKKVNLMVSASLVFVTIAVSMILISGMSSTFLLQGSELKKKTDTVVANVAAYGFQYYFGNTSGNGGIENGKIGNAQTVVLDGKTDLVIDLVPFTMEEVFLPMFSAYEYDSKTNQWKSESESYNLSRRVLANTKGYRSYAFSIGDNHTNYLPGMLKDEYLLSSFLLMEKYHNDRENGSEKPQPVMSMRIKNEDLNEVQFRTNYSMMAEGNFFNNGYRAVFSDPEYKRSFYSIKRGESAIYSAMFPLTSTRDLTELISQIDYSNMYNMYYLNRYYSSRYTYYTRSGGVYRAVASTCKDQGFDSMDMYATQNANGSEIKIYYGNSGRDPVTLYTDADEALDGKAIEEFNNFYSDNVSLAKQEIKIIKQIQNYLKEDFRYTLSPGRVPYGLDPIEYFLNSSHKGYCVYFASAATLMLRNQGVPARYVEGYAFDFSDFDDAVRVGSLYGEDDNIFMRNELKRKNSLTNGSVDYESDYELFGYGYDDITAFNDVIYEGYNPLGMNSSDIYELDLTDANAHAWVEVYIYGFGWVPFEFTLAAQDENAEGNNSLLSRLMNNRNSFFSEDTLNDVTENISDGTVQEAVSEGIKGSVFIIVIGLVILIFCRYLLSIYRQYFSRPDNRVNNQYKHLCRIVKRLLMSSNPSDKDKVVEINRLNLSYKETAGILINTFNIDPEIVSRYFAKLSEYNFDTELNQDVKVKLVNEITTDYKYIRKNLRTYMGALDLVRLV